MTEPAGADRRAATYWTTRLADWRTRVPQSPALQATGALTRAAGLTLEAGGCRIPVGGRCRIRTLNDGGCAAEAVGFDGDRVYLMPVDEPHGLAPGARVEPLEGDGHIAVGSELLGRVIDAHGDPLDDGPDPACTGRAPLTGRSINPLARAGIDEPLDVGVRAINGLATVGRGQRMGLFAGSGVGKSVLLGMMTRYTEADVVVVGLIGERAREVGEFVHRVLGPDGMKRAVVVAAPAGQPPLMRVQGALRATAIAEHFRDQGLRVLLLMDSLTRFAQAQREIGLAIGEPPATKGYTPSVFDRLPHLVERAGTGTVGGGSITAFYTVLTEGDDHNDPIADASRAILDGHLVLSRAIAERGRFPAIDIDASVSRVMTNIVDQSHLDKARAFRAHQATYTRHADLIKIGAYQRGSDPRIDAAIDLEPRLEAYLAQDISEPSSLADSIAALDRMASANAETSG
jgi:flagellum-specific ATP synthase